mgnify:FL=1
MADYFNSPNAGQNRRAWLNGLLGSIGDSADYYLGPTGVPDRARSAGQIADMVSPVSGTLRSMDAAGRGNYGESALEGVGVLAPAAIAARFGAPAAKAVAETMTGTGNALADTGSRAYQDVVSRLNQPGDMGTLYSNPLMAPFDMRGGARGNGGPRISLLDDTANLPPHSRPEWTGAAENRTTPYPRYDPARGAPARMDRLTSMLDDPNHGIHDRVRGYVSKGQELGGEDWYNTEELRDWFVDELGQELGDSRWREYINAVGHTSTGSSVPMNLRNASLYYMLEPADRLRVADMVKNTPRTTPRMAVEALGIDVPNMPVKYGYGHKMQGTQAGNVANAERGLWDRDAADDLTGAALTKQLSANSKVKGFLNNLLGDDTNIAADKHFMRVLAMSDGGTDFLSGQAELSAANREILRGRYGNALDAYTVTRTKDGKTFTNVNLSKAAKDGVITDTDAFSEMPTAWEDMPKATEYKALENVAQRLAAQQSMTPAQFQANLWMGAGDVTGLADESQGTFMELFRRTADKRAAERGVTRTDQIRDFINKAAPMAIVGGGVGLSQMRPNGYQPTQRPGLLSDI